MKRLLPATLLLVLLSAGALAQSASPANPDVDVGSVITAIASIYPPITAYLPQVSLLFMAWCGLCAAITSFCPPPTTVSPGWWIGLYRFLGFFAARWGHGLPAVVPGMEPAAAAAMRASAKTTAADPTSAMVVKTGADVAGQTVVNSGVPALSK